MNQSSNNNKDSVTASPQSSIRSIDQGSSVGIQGSSGSEILEQQVGSELTVEQMGQPSPEPQAESLGQGFDYSVLGWSLIILPIVLIVTYIGIRAMREVDDESAHEEELEPKPLKSKSAAKKKSTKKRSAPNQLKKKSQRKATKK